MIAFGPAGNSLSFYDRGYKATEQAPAYLVEMGLNAYECSFGRGVSMGEKTALAVGEAMRGAGITVSVHAPYFINLANPDEVKRMGSFRYILEAARAARHLGARRVVVHVGAQLKLEREAALKNCEAGLIEAYRRMDDEGLGDVVLCPETMGKASQIGNLEETLRFCALDERFVPCVDFAHLHALSHGGLTTPEAFDAVLEAIVRALGVQRAASFHIHFSTIQFTDKGEKRHMKFSDADFGPRFELLAPLLKARGMSPTVICESDDTMAEDARAMREIWENL